MTGPIRVGLGVGLGLLTSWLREVCEVPVVFVTGYNDPDTIERIHERVPGAPGISKPEYRKGLADAVAEVTEQAGLA